MAEEVKSFGELKSTLIKAKQPGADDHPAVPLAHLEAHVGGDERRPLERQAGGGRHRPGHPQVAEQVVLAVRPVRVDPVVLPEEPHDAAAGQDGFTPVTPTL